MGQEMGSPKLLRRTEYPAEQNDCYQCNFSPLGEIATAEKIQTEPAITGAGVAGGKTIAPILVAGKCLQETVIGSVATIT